MLVSDDGFMNRSQNM